MHDHLRKFQKFIIHEIEILLHYKEKIEVQISRLIDYVDILDTYNTHKLGGNYYLERTFRTFYGRTATKEVEQLYAIDSIEDLFRFEFVTMV